MKPTTKKVLLICGILSSLLYIGTDILASIGWEAYSYTDQAISELMAIGAPTRPFVVLPFTLYNPLVIAFGIGVWLSAGEKRSQRITGVLLVAYGMFSLTGPFFPMHQRGAEGSITDIMHIIITVALVLSMVLFIGFGAVTRGKGFRLYSMGTLLILVVFGALAFMQGPQIAAGLPTPWFGVIERMNIYTSMLWVLVLAVSLLRAPHEQAQNTCRILLFSVT